MAEKQIRASAPDHELAAGDPGDETGRRYRFQYAWSAIWCCAVIDETEDVIEVFCEHHEDVLLKHGDGSFTGEQVKTRESDQPPWKAGEETVRAAFARFVKLDADYPDCFRAFRFCTNHPMFVARTGQSIPFLLEQVASADDLSDLADPVRAWVAKIAKQANVDPVRAFVTLKKCRATDGLPKLQDSTMRLADAVSTSWAEASECTHPVLVSAARALLDECARAATLDHEQVLPAYIAARDEDQSRSRINGKRMDGARIRAILGACLSGTAPLVGSSDPITPSGKGRPDLLSKKLDAGGFSAVSVNSANDLRDKADYLAISWTKKHGKRAGLDRYQHVRSIALSDAARAFESTQRADVKFGPQMRENFRDRLDARRSLGSQLYDCTNEHLEGFSYILTSECVIQWSVDRPWEEE